MISVLRQRVLTGYSRGRAHAINSSRPPAPLERGILGSIALYSFARGIT